MNHWPRWNHFVKAEVGAKGPDPQFALIAELGKDADAAERAWLAGCYCSHHCVPSAYAVWMHWRIEDVMRITIEELTAWLIENWAALPVRPEMRSHRMPFKRAECLRGFARYALLIDKWQNKDYDFIWDDSQKEVKYYGRYMAIKYLELLRVMGVTPSLLSTSIHARDGWGPRITLADLIRPFSPDMAEIVGNRYNNTELAVTMSEEAAKIVRHETWKATGIDLTYFQLQVLLCEYREMRAGGFYPGAGHDEELEYIEMTGTKFLAEAQRVLDARRRIFPDSFLGEVGGWNGIREDQRMFWRDHPDFKESER